MLPVQAWAQTETIDVVSMMRIWFVALFLETLLYGCGLLQAWLYFRRYRGDHWRLRAMIATLIVLEGVQIVVFFELLYKILVGPNSLSFISLYGFYWEEIVQSFPTYLSAFIVQIHFAICVYHLKKTDRIVPICIAFLATIALVSGFAQVAASVVLSDVVHFGSWGVLGVLIDSRVIALYILQGSATLVCDVMITSFLLRRLGNAKTGIKKSDAMVNRLMVNAINRGGLTAAVAAINVILILAVRDSLSFYLPLIISSKLYMNSVLASLNARDSIKETYINGSVTNSSITLPDGLSSTTNAGRSWTVSRNQFSTHPALEITVHSDICTDSEHESDVNGKKETALA